MSWEQVGVIVGALSPLVGVPLVMITLYLRTIRDHHAQGLSSLLHRVEVIELSIRELHKSASELDREFATKEEWVRESMLARQNLERLTEMVTRIQTELENGHGLAAQIGRMTSSIAELARRFACARCDEAGSPMRESMGRPEQEYSS